MKIGLISDIHAYLDDLTAALALLESLNVDEIVCAGDLTDGGPDGDAVVAELFRREIPCVQGNHDRDAFRSQAELRRLIPDKTSPLLLDPRTVAQVAGLPLVQTFVWEGVRVCLAHGTPTHNAIYLFPKTSTARYDEALAADPARIFLLGHTHMPMRLRYRERWFFNAGSVSCNRPDDSRTCGVLTLPGPTFEVYDLATGQPIPLETVVRPA